MKTLACLLALALCACTRAAAPDAPAATPPPAPEPAFPGGRSARVVPGTDACTTDADCVPSACCHATSCVARTSAPACDGVMCTRSCVGGSIDCGGGCLCQEGRCSARLMTRPEAAQ